jgi:hypothetical protein
MTHHIKIKGGEVSPVLPHAIVQGLTDADLNISDANVCDINAYLNAAIA